MRGGRNETRRATFSSMERVFLAVIVSGLLLAAASVSLLVATSGGNTVAELKLPPAATVSSGTHQTRGLPDNRAMPRDDRRDETRSR
jgi:hypothetical protein